MANSTRAAPLGLQLILKDEARLQERESALVIIIDVYY